MSQSLPSKPSLEHLKKQAKNLLAAYKAGEPDASKRIAAYFKASEKFALATAQLVLAREHGFPSWAALKKHIQAEHRTLVENFVEAGLGDAKLAKELWHANRAELRRDPAAAAMAGDVDALRSMLRTQRSSANSSSSPKPRPSPPREGPVSLRTEGGGGAAARNFVKDNIGPKDRPILTYACFSRLINESEFDNQILETVRFLLHAGADPNGYFMAEWAGEMFRQTPIYGAAGVLNNAALTKLLLDNGADPNEGDPNPERYGGEAVYHACDHPGQNECLRLLFEAGASQAAKDYCLLRKLDSEDPEGVLLFLRYGANPNRGHLRTAINHALLRNRSVEMIKLLLDHGADPTTPDADGTSPYVVARRYGLHAQAELLAERGASTDLEPYDALLVAAADGDSARVKQLAREHPEVLTQISKYGRQPSDGEPLGSAGEILHDLARAGQAEGLKALIELGMDPGLRNGYNETPLHWACVAGRVDAAKVLVEAGAPLDVQEKNHNATPLGWAEWGSRNWKDPHGDYEATIAFMEAMVPLRSGGT